MSQFFPQPHRPACLRAAAGIFVANLLATSMALAQDATLPEIQVTAGGDSSDSGAAAPYHAPATETATGLNLAPQDTPQSVSSLSSAQMSDFNLTNANAALANVTGVTVEKVETDRTYYTARGFDISNFQVDGIGLPMAFGLVDGDMDTAIYDRIDVVRGADGLMTGVGNPSATVNFVRKRPTRDTEASVDLSYGSWDDRREEADISGSLSSSGGVRGRLVAANEDRDSYLDRYHNQKNVLYGVVEADLSNDSVLSVGQSLQQNRPDGVMWGALPLNYSNGVQTSYPVSTSTAPAWTHWNNDTAVTFVELQQALPDNWLAKAVYTHKQITEHSQLLYVYGTPNQSDGSGLAIFPSRYDMSTHEDNLDLRASGPFQLAGRAQELVVGASSGSSHINEFSLNGDNVGAAFPDLATWNGQLALPTFDVPGGMGDITYRQQSLYSAARLSATDALKLIVGANYTSVSGSGTDYGSPEVRDDSKAVPYAGAILRLDPRWSLYSSWTGVFNPQTQIGPDLQRLAPAEGKNVEAGIKGELFDKKLSTSFAVFDARLNNLAQQDYYDAATNQTIYSGVDTISKGYEAEASGNLSNSVSLSSGYTQLSLHDNNGNDVRTFTPRRMLHLTATWQALPRLKLGSTLNWRSRTWYDQGSGVISNQPSYALLDLMARWDFSKHFSAALNLDNVTDRKYLASLYWSQGFYGTPRSATASVKWTY